MFHVPNEYRVLNGALSSTNDDGNNGCFSIPFQSPYTVEVIASDGEGWEHVSVHMVNQYLKTKGKPPFVIPPWEVMNIIKDIFWDKEDCVMQLHPPKNAYVNNHKYTLHLWKPIGVPIPRPQSWMVGVAVADVVEPPSVYVTVLQGLTEQLNTNPLYYDSWEQSLEDTIHKHIPEDPDGIAIQIANDFLQSFLHTKIQ